MLRKSCLKLGRGLPGFSRMRNRGATGWRKRSAVSTSTLCVEKLEDRRMLSSGIGGPDEQGDPIPELQIMVNLLEDVGGAVGTPIVNDTVRVGDSFFVEIAVADIRPFAAGVTGLSIGVAWNPIVFSEIDVPFDPGDPNSPLVTVHFPEYRGGALDPAGGFIDELMGGSIPAAGLGREIGLGELEQFSLLHFQADAATMGFEPFEVVLGSGGVSFADGAQQFFLDIEPQTIRVLSPGPQVDVQLAAVATPTPGDQVAALPDSLAEVVVEDTCFVEVWAQDVGIPGLGIIGGQVDISYTTPKVDGMGLDHGGLFNLFPSGSIDEAAGLIDDFGGGTLSGGVGVAPSWARLGYVEYVVTSAGQITFALYPGNLAFSRFGAGNVAWEDVVLGDLTLNAKGTSCHIFYNESAFDGNNPAADAQDDDAVATDKHALTPGQTATFANFTSYTRGINAVMVDVPNLAGTPTTEDFRFRLGNDNQPDGWEPVTTTPTITVRAGEGEDGCDRLTITWNEGDIPTRNWLQVRVKATPNTGLVKDEVFYFGSVVGDADGDGVAAYADMYAIYQQIAQPATVDSPLDIDRDGAIAYADMYATYQEIGQPPALQMITVPSVVTTDDVAATDNDAAVVIDVLANDRDVAGDPLSVPEADARSTFDASVTVNPDGTITYDPRDSAVLFDLAPGQMVEDVFSYLISDAGGGTDTAMVTVMVYGADQPPSELSQESLALVPPDDGPLLPATGPDSGENVAGIDKTSAHDAVLEETIEQRSGSSETSFGKLAWLYHAEQLRATNRPSKKDNSLEEAVDQLLATCWP